MTTDLALAIGVMITVGILGGMVANKSHLPRVSGYIIVGIILSPSVLNLVGRETVHDLSIITHAALGIVAYLIGASLNFKMIRRLGKSISWITPLQSLGAWLVVTLSLAYIMPNVINIPGATFNSGYLPIALILGAIASATAPAVTMAVIRELKARGPMTTTLLAVVAIDDAISVIAFAVAAGIVGPMIMGISGGYSLYGMIGAPALGIAQAIGIGVGLGFILLLLSRVMKTRALLLAAVIGIILLATGVSNFFGISLIMTNMAIGVVMANRTENREPVIVIEGIEEVVFNIFFVLAGMHFDAAAMKGAGIVAVILFGIRFAGKYFGTALGAKISRAPAHVRKYLGLALVPQAGVALGLALLAAEMFPSIGGILFNIVLGSVIISELVAPPLTKYAIIRSGEVEGSVKVTAEPT